MNLSSEKQPKKSTKCSIETAVEYLIDECVRADRYDRAFILKTALRDLSDESFKYISKDDELRVISFLREFMNLSDDSKQKVNNTIKHIEAAYANQKQ